jgi:superfamily II DNA or RNA helicase
MPTDIAEQIDRRRKRGVAEITKIVNQGNHPVFSLFEVSSVSGRAYRVEIRSLTELHNTCACPDYRTNLIGTCKHIEGVISHLKEKYEKRIQDLAQERPTGTQIFLRHGMEVSVRVAQPLPDDPEVRDLLKRFFDPTGAFIGAPTQALPGLFATLDALPERKRALVRVEQAVREHLDLLQDQDAIREQKAWFLEQVAQGNRSFGLLSTKLYPYQEEGALHLAFSRRTMLADDMGLGKTIQAIAASALLKELRDIRSVLIVCPASLKHQWAREIRRFTSLSVGVVEGGLKERRRLYREPAFFRVLNYEIVRRDLEELEKLQPDLIILDEAQRIKNWRAKTAGAVKRLRSRYAFVLTGTPLENRLDELYSIFQFIDPRILGPLWHFNDRFFQLERRKSGSYRVLGYRNLQEFRAIIAPYSLRRNRDEVLKDLPERVDNNFFVEMTPQQWGPYNEFKETVAKLASIAKRRPLTPKEHDILLKSLLKMRIIANALALHDREIPPGEQEKTAPKLRELAQILEEQMGGNGHRALIFSQWSGMLALTEPVLRRLGLGYVKLTGDVPSAKRGDLIQRFFEDPECRVFLSTDAGGVGLNLQAASLVINLDLPWNPAVLEQRIGRAHRHGQKRSVQVINLVAQGTIEERMLDTLAVKRSVFAGVFGPEGTPADIAFEDAGPTLLQQLDEMLQGPSAVQLDLEPTAPSPEETPEQLEVEPEEPKTRPSVKSLADRLVAMLPGRVLLVRKAPTGAGILVVVDHGPAELRSPIEASLAEHYPGEAPPLHLMEREGYQALMAMLPGASALPEPDSEGYRSPSLPRSTTGSGEDPVLVARRRRAGEGLEAAARRLELAEVLINGGFPEELLRPMREAMGWALSSLLALHRDCNPSADLPSPRLISAELVEKDRLPEEVALPLSRVRELTESTEGDAEVPPPSLQTAERLLAAVRTLIEFSQTKLAELAL